MRGLLYAKVSLRIIELIYIWYNQPSKDSLRHSGNKSPSKSIVKKLVIEFTILSVFLTIAIKFEFSSKEKK